MMAATNKSGAERSKPMAQTMGSVLDQWGLSFWAIKAPIGTPNTPDSMVIAPNVNATLQKHEKRNGS
jgi:hypothetical protein